MQKINQSNFTPPYCPNFKCSFHTKLAEKFWVKNGKAKVKKYPGFIQRYKCKACKKNFSYTSFKLEYRRRSDPFEDIFNLTTESVSNSGIARKLGISEHKVRECLKVLARQCLLKHELLTQNLEIKEDLVFDGFESFSRSQYDPNNINNLVLKDSFFTLDFSFSHLNRKGRMTLAQKIKNKKLQQKYGKYPSNQIRTKSKMIF